MSVSNQINNENVMVSIEELMDRITKNLIYTTNLVFLEKTQYNFNFVDIKPDAKNIIEFYYCVFCDIDFYKFNNYSVQYFIQDNKEQHNLFVVFEKQEEFTLFNLKN